MSGTLLPPTSRVSRSTWIAFASITAGTFAVNLDRTMVSVALPQIGAALGAGGLDAVVTVNLVAVAVASPGAGWLADRFGTRRVLLGALVVFVVASLAAASASSLLALIVTRALQGASGGVTLAVTLAAIHALFEPAQRPRAFAVQAAVVMVSPAIGPIYGGWVSALHWRATFVAIAAVGAGALALSLKHLPSAPAPGSAGRVDWPGWLLAAVALPMILMSATFGNEWNWTSPRTLLLGACGLSALGAFVFRELRVPAPLMELRALGNGTLRSTFVLEWLITIPYQSQFVLLPLELTSVFGASPLAAGSMITPSAIGTMLSLRPASRLLARHGVRVNVLIGCGFLGFATVALGFISPDTPLWMVALIMVPHGLGGGFCLMPLLVAGLDAVEPRLVPQVSAMRIVNKLLAQAVGVSVSVAILVALVGGDLLERATSDPLRVAAANVTVNRLLVIPVLVALLIALGPGLRIGGRGRSGSDALDVSV